MSKYIKEISTVLLFNKQEILEAEILTLIVTVKKLGAGLIGTYLYALKNENQR